MARDLCHIDDDGRMTPVISLRDQCAIAALQGMASNHRVLELSSESTSADLHRIANGMAADAYAFADAMMRARNDYPEDDA